jgi:hypothetical protein
MKYIGYSDYDRMDFLIKNTERELFLFKKDSDNTGEVELIYEDNPMGLIEYSKSGKIFGRW